MLVKAAAPRGHAPGYTPLAAGEPARSPFFCGDFLHHLNLEIALASAVNSARRNVAHFTRPDHRSGFRPGLRRRSSYRGGLLHQQRQRGRMRVCPNLFETGRLLGQAGCQHYLWCSFAQDRPELVLKSGKRRQQHGGIGHAWDFETACNVVGRMIRKVRLDASHPALCCSVHFGYAPLSPGTVNGRLTTTAKPGALGERRDKSLPGSPGNSSRFCA